MRSTQKFYSFFILLFIFISEAASAQEFPNLSTQKFINYEVLNDYKPKTTVSKDYQPGKKRIFPLQYVDIPTSELNITDSRSGSEAVRKQVLIQKDGRQYFRFFIHPDSEHLYQSLIQRYRWSGFYWASATSSTRSVVAWNPKAQEPPLYLKLSLAQIQDGLGRIIPDWEVRRSVGITAMIQQTPLKIWEKHGATVLPEYLGATIKRKENLGFVVDKNQGEVFEHGLIAREADFLSQAGKYEIMPLFGLFTKRNGRPPLIISLWAKSGESNFYKFIENFLFKSFLEKNAYLFFHQGIVPEIHGQNVLIAYDPKAQQIAHYYHRDVGSMNVDLRLRYIHGLSIEPLRSENAAFDFKFARATEKYESVHLDYLNDWIFRWGYLKVLKEYIPDFSPDKTKARLQKLLLKKVRETLPLRGRVLPETVEDHMKTFYSENPPMNWKPIGVSTTPEKVSEFIRVQKERSQYMDLPDSWTQHLSFLQGDLLFTEYGLVRLEKDKTLRLYYYSSKALNELKVAAPQAAELNKLRKRSSLRKVGFYSGTFDPPHSGHLSLIQKAVRELQLEKVYIIPNLSPSHKPGASNNEDRLQMTKLAFADLPEAVVADAEQMKIMARYGVGGLQRYLSQLHPQDLVFQVMGDDSYERLRANPEIQFPKNFVIAVSGRDEKFELLESSHGKNRVISLGSDTTGYSSTLFRKQIKDGEKPIQLAPSVLNYISSKYLYRDLIRCNRIYR